MSGRSEAGVAVVLAGVAVALLTVLAVLCAGLVSLVVAQRRVQASADLAALAGAAALQSGTAPCAAVLRVAVRNGTPDARCSVSGSVVDVVVRVRLRRLPGMPGIGARARAGPG